MTTATLPAPPALPQVGLVPYRFSVEDYHKMIEAGILKSGDPCELIEGLVVQKIPKNPPHCAAVTRIRRRIEALAGAGLEVSRGEADHALGQ